MSVVFVLGMFIEMGIRLAIPGLVVSTIVILLIQKMLIKESKEFRIRIYISIIILCVIASFTFLLWKFEKPNELYLKMNEFHNSQSLVGLSEEETIKLLGEPKQEYNTKENIKGHTYYAGNIRKEWYWGKCYTTDYYEFTIFFNSNNKVEYTKITKMPKD